jgi:uncharacterized membrane protein
MASAAGHHEDRAHHKHCASRSAVARHDRILNAGSAGGRRESDQCRLAQTALNEPAAARSRHNCQMRRMEVPDTWHSGGFTVTPERRRPMQPVSPLLSRSYRHPFHPALVTVPIGAWVASLIFDIASHLVSTPAFLTAGSKWLMAIGIAGAVAASVAGFVDFASIPEGTRVYRTAYAHMIINMVLIVTYAANLIWRAHAPARASAVGAGMLALSAACVALLTVSGFLGGRLTYRFGVHVADDITTDVRYRGDPRYAEPESDYR